jgi:hypothetical protein
MLPLAVGAGIAEEHSYEGQGIHLAEWKRLRMAASAAKAALEALTAEPKFRIGDLATLAAK